MFSEGIQVQLDPEAQDRPLRRIAGVKVWPELGFTGSEQKAGGLRTGGRLGSVGKDGLESHIPLG